MVKLEPLAKPRGFAGIQNPEVRIQNEFKIENQGDGYSF
jgi:hypothetical protein